MEEGKKAYNYKILALHFCTFNIRACLSRILTTIFDFQLIYYGCGILRSFTLKKSFNRQRITIFRFFSRTWKELYSSTNKHILHFEPLNYSTKNSSFTTSYLTDKFSDHEDRNTVNTFLPKYSLVDTF